MSPRDFTDIKAEYVTGNLSLRQLAEKHGVQLRTVQDKSSREGWVAARMAHRQKVVNSVSDTAAAAAAKKLEAACVAADMLMSHITAALGDPDVFRKYIIRTTTESGEGESYAKASTSGVQVLDRADTKSMRDMVEALRGITAALRDLYDLPTQAERHAQLIAAGHLRVAQAKSANDNQGGAEIVITGGAEYAE